MMKMKKSFTYICITLGEQLFFSLKTTILVSRWLLTNEYLHLILRMRTKKNSILIFHNK